ncbi:MAG TPA: hypothetical protein VIS73_07875 [Rhodocyclaceae bacterium]
MSAHSAIRVSLARRWASVLLRAAHLVAVIGLAAEIVSATTASSTHAHLWPAAVLVTGLALFTVDFWARPGRLLELLATSIAAKLLLVALMIVLPTWKTPLFWVIIVWSVIFSHAPATFRHARIWRRRAPR